MRHLLRRYFGSLFFGILLLASIVLGAAGGLLFVYASDLPQVESLESYRPNVVTEVYGDDGQIIGSFALERRIIVQPGQVPQVVKDAIVSVEDQNFYRHWGLDFVGISRAALKNILAGRVVEGGSTITQQLSENVFLSPRREWALKLKEALLSIQIERHYTKEEILTLYVNQIYLGHGMYGFAAAAEFYFGKELEDLSVEEAAMLAALPRAPGNYSPISHPDRALMRRNYAIDRMVAEGALDPREGEQAKQRPLRLNPQRQTESIAPYFLEAIRQYLEETYGTFAVHERGLRVYSTLNVKMQRDAATSLREGLRAYDKRHGWRGPEANLLDQGIDNLETHSLAGWRAPLQAGSLAPGIVLEVGNESATVRIGEYVGRIGAAEIAWTGSRSPAQVLSRGDVATFLVRSVDPARKAMEVTLDQQPRVEGAVLVLDHRTGEIKAMVGGYDFQRDQFNRATQALRQTGSAFKPLLYTAAIQAGMSPETILLDEPVNFDGYAPTNYDGTFLGPITLRQALAQSRNVPAVRVLDQIGFDGLIPLVKRFGITQTIERYLPIALGATDVSLLEMTSAYSTFPNGGVRITPRMINRVTDYDGVVLEEDFPMPNDVISADVAAQMVDLLQEVVRTGTGQKARSLDRPVGGKTGTTNDFTDAWFLGFSPSLTAGVWVGFNEKVTLGSSETGGAAALPVWISFMERAHENLPVESFATPATLRTSAPDGRLR